ncbi:hypothetical protein F2Q69_00028967 [Brassica cretica]|uniref:Uncharacterized protein n=1 Tax=Brassica cretica TaxID=69181 RepID=A0A8S9S8D0_BRACR|nr:hypothetical protein F2Q69_00028967 [Brassica cretica]
MVQRISIVPESTALFRPARPQNEVEDVPDIYHGARDRFSRERLIFRAGSPFQASRRRKWLSTESTSERGLVASQNLRKGEKLLFVPPSLVIRADSYPRVKPRDLTLEPTDRAVALPNPGQTFLFLGPCGMVKSNLYSLSKSWSGWSMSRTASFSGKRAVEALSLLLIVVSHEGRLVGENQILIDISRLTVGLF